MFRRLPNKLPPDITFPASLAELGYFVTENDQVRQTADPEKKYQYKINCNERVNDVYKEAMNTSNRAIVLQRLADIGLETIRLPIGSTEQDKHIPILVSPNLSEKKHVVVVFTERHIDLGILSYRVLGEEGINIGSIVNFVKNILESPVPPAGRPGLIIANPSQLIWYRGGGRAVTDREWMCLPRESAVHNAMRIDEVKNRVEGNRDFAEHVQYIFENVLSSQLPPAPIPAAEDKPTQSADLVSINTNISGLCNINAKFSIIGLEYPGSTAVQYIASNWPTWRHRISCVALCNPQHTLKELLTNPILTSPNSTHNTNTHASPYASEISSFIARRTRAYRMSAAPVETLLSSGLQDPLGCNVYSSGESLYEESVFVRCWPSILDWIDLCRFSEGYREPVFEAGSGLEDDVNALVGASAGAGAGANAGGATGAETDAEHVDRRTAWNKNATRGGVLAQTDEESEAARYKGEVDVPQVQDASGQ